MQYQGIAYKLAQEYLPYTDNAVDLDDLLQAGHVGAIRAAESYDPGKGTWYKWCSYYIRQEMQALCGFRTSKVDAAHDATSLDAPITEDGGTLADVLPGNTPTPEEDWDREAVASAVRESVGKLREDRRCVIELLYFDGKTYAEAAEALSVSLPAVTAARHEAFSDLRRDPVIVELGELMGFYNKTKTRHNLERSLWGFMTERRKPDGEQTETERGGTAGA